MARRLPVTLISVVKEAGAEFPPFDLAINDATITIRGHLSTGSRGWRLRAEAACRRSVITINVTAIETEPVRTPDFELHEYEATVRPDRGGKYQVRVAHVFVLRDLGGIGLPRPVFERGALIRPDRR
jgi:hypothetical protein